MIACRRKSDSGATSYSSAPRAHDAAHEAERRALKVNEERAFTAAEIDAFLQCPLRKIEPQNIAG